MLRAPTRVAPPAIAFSTAADPKSRRHVRMLLAAVLAATMAAAGAVSWLAARAHFSHDHERYRDLVRAVAEAGDIARLSGASYVMPTPPLPELVHRLAALPGVRDAFVWRTGDVSLWSSDPAGAAPAPHAADLIDAARRGEPTWSLGLRAAGSSALWTDLLDGRWRAWRVEYLIPVLDAPARNVVAVVDLSADLQAATVAAIRDVWPNTAVTLAGGLATAALLLLFLERLTRAQQSDHRRRLAAEASAMGAECAGAVDARLREFMDAVRADASGAARGERTMRRAQAQHIVSEVDKLERWTSELRDYLDPERDVCAEPERWIDRALDARADRFARTGVTLHRPPTGPLPRLSIGARLFYRLVQAALDRAADAMPHGGALEVALRHLPRRARLEIEIAALGPLVRPARNDPEGGTPYAPSLMFTALRRVGGGLSVTPERAGGFRMVLWLPTAGGLGAYKTLA